MMLRRVASVRSSSAWRSALRAQSSRVATRRHAQAVSALVARGSSEWSMPFGGMRLMSSISSSSAMAPEAQDAAPTAPQSEEAIAASIDGAKESLVTELRPLCSALYTENRASRSVDDLTMQWHLRVTSLLQHESLVAHPALILEVQKTYEQGIAIAMKQREFELARALIDQMEQLTLPATELIYQFLIRAVALQWVSRDRPLTLEELREVDLGANWEHTIVELVRSEDKPLYRKSPLERQQFHDHLRTGISAILADYNANVDKENQRIDPYNAALRVYAANKLPFVTMLRLVNQIPRDSAARSSLNADTFLALLQGARWHDIANTVDRFISSKMMRDLAKSAASGGDEADAKKQSHTVALVWDQALRSLCNSYTERVVDNRERVDGQSVKDLKTIYYDIESEMVSVFPEKRFLTIDDHNKVYEIRVKTAALLGLPRQVQELLEEYKALAPVEFASGQLGKSVFLKALEVFPSIGLKRVTKKDLEFMKTQADVMKAPRVVELQRAIRELYKTLPAKAPKATKKKTVDGDDAAASTADTTAAATAGASSNNSPEAKKTRQAIYRLNKKLSQATLESAFQVAHQNRIRAADRTVNNILAHLVTSSNEEDGSEPVNPLLDLEVAVALMNQYMTTANRFASRMTFHTRELMSEEIIERVFDLFQVVLGGDLNSPKQWEKDHPDYAHIQQLFALATKTAALFWSEKDLEELLLLKKKVLQLNKLEAEDYDRQVFLRVQQRKLKGAYALLQEMHYAGTSPTPLTIHRIVTGVLHKLYIPRGQHADRLQERERTLAKRTPSERTPLADQQHQADDPVDEQQQPVESEPDMYDDDGEELLDMTSSGGDTMDEDEEPQEQAAWGSGPRRLEDLPSFIQEWYNLYHVKPMAKTVVPVFARLFARSNIWEIKRFLQILDAMDGGLTPATEFWLEKRLDAVGKSVADLRYNGTAAKR